MANEKVPQNGLTERTSKVDMDDLWMNMQLSDTGEQLKVQGRYLPYQPRSSRATWEFSNSTADSDPGVGVLRFNSSTQNLVTFVYISDFDQGGKDWGNILLGASVGDRFTVGESVNRAVVYEVTAPVVDATGYVKMPVIFVSETGSVRDGNLVVVEGVDSLILASTIAENALLRQIAYRSACTGIIEVDSFAVNSDNVSVDIGAVTAQFVMNTGVDALSPKYELVEKEATTGVTTPYLTTNNITAVGIDKDGNYVFQADSNFTNTQLRDVSQIGIMVHTDRATIDRVVFRPLSAIGITAAGQDLTRAIQPVSIKGNKYSGVSGSAEVSRTAGEFLVLDGNVISNPKDPHTISTLLENPVQDMLYVARDGSNLPCTGVNKSVIPNLWDDATITTDPKQINNLQAIPSNKYVNHLLVSFSEGRTNIQMGQKLFNSQSDALADLTMDVAEVIENNALKMCWLTVKGTATDFSDPLQAVFTNGDKFGVSAG